MSEKVGDSRWALGQKKDRAEGCDFARREVAEYEHHIRFLGFAEILDGH
jgi:hypothetical protein